MLAIAIAFACGKDEAGDKGDPFDARDRAGALAAAQCTNNTRCRPAIYRLNASTEAACVQEATADFMDNFDRVAQAIEGGRVKFHADKLDSCIDSLESGDCMLGASDDCATFFEGKQPVGEACKFSFECTPDAFCDAGRPGSCGKCVRRPGLGESCGDGPCGAGQACREVCVAITQGEGDSCGEGSGCRGKLACMGGTCQRPAGRDESCDSSQESAPRCDADLGLVCVNGTCGERTFNEVGGPCDGETNACNVHGFCNASTDQCTALPGDGQSCAPGGLCADGHFCAGGSCEAAKGEGERCADSVECSGTLFCVEAGACGQLSWSEC
jgi:hypothetical protein